MISAYIKNHTISKKAHEELMAMSHLDDDVGTIFKESEFELTNKIVEILNITISYIFALITGNSNNEFSKKKIPKI